MVFEMHYKDYGTPGLDIVPFNIWKKNYLRVAAGDRTSVEMVSIGWLTITWSQPFH